MLSFQYDCNVLVKIFRKLAYISLHSSARWNSINLQPVSKVIESTSTWITPINCSCNEIPKTSKMVTYKTTSPKDHGSESSDICTKYIPFFERRKNSSWLQPLVGRHITFNLFCVQKSTCSPCI